MTEVGRTARVATVISDWPVACHATIGESPLRHVCVVDRLVDRVGDVPAVVPRDGDRRVAPVVAA
jgi:hypothetical protein